MEMEPLTWQSLATPTAAVLATSFLLLICKAALKQYWTSLANGIGALVFGVAISVSVVAALGPAEPVWATLLLAGFNGLYVAGAVLGVSVRYDNSVRND